MSVMSVRFEHVLRRHKTAHAPETKALFWAAFERLGNASAAAQECGINRDTAKSWLRRYKERLKREDAA